jgi:hypothetical protein
MEDVTSRFRRLLEQTLIPDFCSKSARNMNPSDFRDKNLSLLSKIDMDDFLRGWEAQILKPTGGGLYKTDQGGASEQFFWSGRKANAPRTFTLWIEPIISLAVLALMHLDLGWPKTLVDTQSERDWAFDIFGCKSESNRSMFIACEVKKSRKEVDALISDMQSFGRQPSLSSEFLKGSKRNAFRKVKALRKHKPHIFWAVGPGRYEKVFSVQSSEDDVIEFDPISTQSLAWRVSPH